ncbi:hypothetical protein [Variovorax boronicumulans]|uniref:hypothetical protein n=1 Tax=Variovorax boronicumulans TaxID=436515 RepID=UPI001C592B26
MSAAHDTQALIEELDAAAERITRYSNNPLDGLLSAAARKLEKLAAIASRLQEQEGQPALSEREQFEAWVKEDRGDLRTFGSGSNMHYRNSAVNQAWTGWHRRATLAAGSQAVHVPGWKNVPTKPTDAMLMAGRAVDVESPGWATNLSITNVGNIYRAMLDAAPLQPLAGGEVQA